MIIAVLCSLDDFGQIFIKNHIFETDFANQGNIFGSFVID